MPSSARVVVWKTSSLKDIHSLNRYFWKYFWTVYQVLFKVLGAAAAAKLLQSCTTLCDPIDCSPAGSPVPGILQARTLEWVAISFSSAWKWSCSVVPTLSDPMDCSLPSSSIHRIFQARVLEWGATAFSVRTGILGIKSPQPSPTPPKWVYFCSHIFIGG